MRPSCLFCATKHLSQALILLNESLQGYPTHRWLAYGHMAEASDELIQDHPLQAENIRNERKRLEQGAIEDGRTSRLMDLIKEVVDIFDTPIEAALREEAAPVVLSDERPPVKVHYLDSEMNSGKVISPGQAWVTPSGRIFYRTADKVVPLGVLGPVPKPIPKWMTDRVHWLINRYLALPPKPTTDTFFTIEDGNGKRRVQATPAAGAGAAAKTGCTPCAAKARKIKEAQDALRAAQAAGEVVREALTIKKAEQAAAQFMESEDAVNVDQKANSEDWTKEDTAQVAEMIGHKGPEVWSTVPTLRGHRGTVIILTTLADFSPSYSLSTCIKDQALALAVRGYDVRLYMQERARFDVTELPGVHILPLFPSISWKEDTIDDAAVDRVIAFLHNIQWTGVQAVISHDLMFQSWFVSAAKAIHLFSDKGHETQARWFHLAHSSVGVRPQAANDAMSAIYWRTNIPRGHTVVCLNEFDRDWFDRWYSLPAGSAQMIRNVRDPRSSLNMSIGMRRFITEHELASADVVCLLPLSLPRWREKGVLKVLDFLAKVKGILAARVNAPAPKIRFVIAAAHANNTEERATFEKALNDRIGSLGFYTHEVVCTYDHFPELSGPGLGRVDMDVLWRLSNLFVFPSVSEAGSLVLLEAIDAGCELVLNDSVPAFNTYAPDSALWVSWGSQKLPAAPSYEDQEQVVANLAVVKLDTRPRVRRWEDLADDWDALLSRHQG